MNAGEDDREKQEGNQNKTRRCDGGYESEVGEDANDTVDDDNADAPEMQCGR